MKKMFKALLFPIWLVLEVVVFVLELVMVLSTTVLILNIHKNPDVRHVL